jgi:hypothetical protein
MKGMADELCSLGEELPDRHLVLQLLCGLSKKFDHMKALLKRTKPLPSSYDVRNDLELEELDMEPAADPTSAAVLYAVSVSTASSAPPSSHAPTGGPPRPAASLKVP